MAIVNIYELPLEASLFLIANLRSPNQFLDWQMRTRERLWLKTSCRYFSAEFRIQETLNVSYEDGSNAKFHFMRLRLLRPVSFVEGLTRTLAWSEEELEFRKNRSICLAHGNLIHRTYENSSFCSSLDSHLLQESRER